MERGHAFTRNPLRGTTRKSSKTVPAARKNLPTSSGHSEKTASSIRRSNRFHGAARGRREESAGRWVVRRRAAVSEFRVA